MPRQSLMQIQDVEELKAFREHIQQQIYQGISDLKQYREQQHDLFAH